jgi:hypothetical protein
MFSKYQISPKCLKKQQLFNRFFFSTFSKIINSLSNFGMYNAFKKYKQFFFSIQGIPK